MLLRLKRESRSSPPSLAAALVLLLPAPAAVASLLVVERRRVVVGARGRVVGEVGITARRDLETLLHRRVHLILNVKVDRDAVIVEGVE